MLFFVCVCVIYICIYVGLVRLKMRMIANLFMFFHAALLVLHSSIFFNDCLQTYGGDLAVSDEERIRKRKRERDGRERT